MIVIKAPAKVNLSLKILGKRPDGFHELETLMVPLELADEIQITRIESGVTLLCEGGSADVTSDAQNLVWRAAMAYQSASGDREGLHFLVKKQIPSGAGLGGGSSDAAAVLLALEEMAEHPLGMDVLQGLAADLGSDVPFFLYRCAAICKGRGELIQPVTFSWDGYLLLIKPPFSISTPWAFTRYAEMQQEKPLGSCNEEKDNGILFKNNDLEAPVFSKYLVLAVLKRWLLQQAGVENALLCGSGSTMFAAVRERKDAELLADAVKAEFGEAFWTCVTSISF